MSIRLKLILTYLLGTILTTIIVAMTGIGIVTAIFSYLISGIVKDQSPHEAFSRGIDLFVDLRYAERYAPEELTSPSSRPLLGNGCSRSKGSLSSGKASAGKATVSSAKGKRS